jgi:hypothetical protein
VTARWHPDALAEADAAAEIYRDKRRNLARRFLNSLDEALNRIELHPYIYREAVGIGHGEPSSSHLDNRCRIQAGFFRQSITA